ncbi:FAD/NAD(P)-binding protein [Rhodopirellula halodulae]|uniref:FAD/NAD(P)-binding protein n=1 Tax=Rhodopirellula halodulae TaxID=2894198 RepID=UPI001E3CC7FC|nr:FAD/NAD(P)-binding protein [Rhodopirellula sp. JC737]MCC9658395.1 FAD/NAD(P)-binding protein [Rhodopirellula sp. JC737]
MSVAISGGSIADLPFFDGASPRSPIQLAIVGCGPRGLQCLDALSRNLSKDELAQVEITVFEPSTHPGAGCVYDLKQSRMLRMNFATQYIDFWKVDRDQTTSKSGSLIGWLDRNYPEYAASDQFVPRAVVGEYLHDCFEVVCKRLRRWTKLNVVRARVESIRHCAAGEANAEVAATTKAMTLNDDEGWWVWDGSEERKFDRVVLTTGHEGLRSSDEIQSQDTGAFVYPVENSLSEERIPAGGDVFLRGFGLTAIDAILMLTEGRGGTFVQGDGLPTYQASGQEPNCIAVHCRSGRPMLAKPTAKLEPINDRFWEPYRQTLSKHEASHGSVKFCRDIWTVVAEAASELLIRSGDAVSRRDVEEWFRGWSRYKMDDVSARKAMLQSYGVATGAREMDVPFALGEAWRQLYPQIVSLISFGGLAEGQWKAYSQTAAEMERIAFGPPAESVAKVLRLIRDGKVRLCEQNEPSQDSVIVNAVIASPHQANEDGPLSQLILRGDVQVDPVTEAVRVSESGSVLGGRKGLAIFGRATEGWVIGNDTLSRTLHQQIQNWAETIAVDAHSRG